MIPPRLLATLIAIASAIATVSIAAAYPFDQRTRSIISLGGAPPDYLLYSAGETVKQSFEAQQPLLSAISIYAANDRLTNQRLKMSVTNPLGHELVSSSTVQTSYRGGKLKLTFPVSWLTTDFGQPLIARLEHQGGYPLYLALTTENAYKPGHLAYNDTPKPELDLALTTHRSAPITPNTMRGIWISVGILMGTLLIYLMPQPLQKYRTWAAGLLLVIATPAALGGFWQSRHLLGINDWDYYFSVHEVLRRIILTYHTLPFWNPYTCGGTAGLADPESPLLTPTFALELLFGVPIGLRLSIFLATAIGAVGTLALARRIGLSLAGSLAAALTVSFSSVNLLEIVEGHVNIFAAMWLPWIFWSWYGAYALEKHRTQTGTNSKQSTEHKAQKHKPAFGIWNLCFVSLKRWQARIVVNNHWPLVIGTFLALTFYQGGIYLLFYTGIAFLALAVLAKHHRAALAVSARSALWAIGLAAIKLIPVLFWLQQFQDEAYAASTNTLPYLHEIFLGRHPHGSEVLPDQGAGWHEYGAYVGPLVVSLVILSLSGFRRQRTIRLLAGIALTATLLSSAGPALSPFFDVMPFIPRSTISRVIIFAVLALALLTGAGIDQLIRWRPRAAVIIPSLIGLIAVDLMSLAYPLSTQAFIVPPDVVEIAPAPAPIAFTERQHHQRITGIDYPRTYLATLAGYGTISYCTPLSPPVSVVATGSEMDASAITVTDASLGSAGIRSWSPNRVEVQASLRENTDVVLNTNFAKGWKARLGQTTTAAPRTVPAQNIGGRVGLSLPAGDHKLAFRYRAPGFITGAAVTIAALLLAASQLYSYLRLRTRQ